MILPFFLGCEVEFAEGIYSCTPGEKNTCPPGWACRQNQAGANRCYPDMPVDASSDDGSTANDGGQNGDGQVDASGDAGGEVDAYVMCGDNVVQSGEDCEFEDLQNKTCSDYAAFDGGVLQCAEDCTYDTSFCYACGNDQCESSKGETAENCTSDCGWAHVSAGSNHTCGVRNDGTVLCWGSNASLQVGSSSLPTQQKEPYIVTLPVAHDALQVSAGHAHTCVIVDANQNNVVCWGANDEHQVGAPHMNGGEPRMPFQVTNFAPALRLTMVAAGQFHTCAAAEGGAVVFCWGADSSGQLGNDTDLDPSIETPQQVGRNFDGAMVLSAGAKHNCVVDSQNTYCWGENNEYQLGDDTQNDGLEPVCLTCSGDLNFSFIACGEAHTIGVGMSSAGQLDGWGDNDSMVNGNTDSNTTYQVPSPTPINNASTVCTSHRHSCIVTLSGPIECWGRGNEGQLGDGNNPPTEPVSPDDPAYVSHTSFFEMVTCGEYHTCAIDVEQRLWCWGENVDGQLGDPAVFDQSDSPVEVK